MNKKDQRFKDIMKQAGAEKPSPDFTAMVMNALEVDLKKEAALKLLLQQQPEEGPSFDFTAGVMAQIIPDKKLSVYKPIISQKVWYGIAAILTVFIGIILLGNSSHTAHSAPSPLTSLLKPLSSLSPVYFMVIVLAVCMLLVDHLVTKPSTKSV